MRSIWLTPKFLFFATAFMLNNIGTVFFDLSMPLLMYELTNSALAMSSIILYTTLAVIVMHPFIGIIVDQTSRKKLIFYGLIIQSSLSVVIFLLYDFDILKPWMVYLVALTDDVSRTFIGIAQFAVISSLFNERRSDATAANSTAFTISTVVAPILGGFLLTKVDLGILLLINSVLCFVPIIFNHWIELPNHKRSNRIKSLRNVVNDIKKVSLYIYNRKKIAKVTLIVALAEIVDANVFAYILVYYLKHSFELPDHIISWVLVTKGIGFFLGTLLPRSLKAKTDFSILLISMLISSVGIAFILTDFWLVTPLALLLVSIGRMAAIVQQNIILQEDIPSELLGRVNSMVRITRLIPSIFIPIIFGWIAGNYNLTVSFSIMLVLSLVPILFLFQVNFDKEDSIMKSKEQDIKN